jgi:hypothetical protein
MEQIIVPQFLDAEDKIFGPITVRQFIELMVAGMCCFVFYKIFDFTLFVVASLVVFFIALVIAFAKINGQSFHDFALNFIQTLKSPKLKVWRKRITIAQIMVELKKPQEIKVSPPKALRQPLTSSHLSELALIIDTGGVYRGEGGG